MGKVIVQDYTYKKPITMIGVEAGICWGANTSNDEKNYLRGIDCLESGHGRTFEFPDVYLTLEGYSARVIREWYTHIGGLPTLKALKFTNSEEANAAIQHNYRAGWSL